MDRIFLITVADLKTVSALHANVDDKLVAPEIEAAQDLHIQPLLGSALYHRLLEGTKAGNLTTDEQNLISGYIARCLVYYTLAALPQGLSLQFYNTGIARKSTDATSTPTMEELIRMAKHYLDRAQYYGERLIRHLQEWAGSGKYPSYDDDSRCSEISPLDDDYDCGLVL